MGLLKNITSCIIKAPFSALYCIGVYLRNKLYDWHVFKSKKFDFPVINVGNITVGGTGKTPHIEYILSILFDNYKLATLSRGYKRKSKGFRYIDYDDNADLAGDEPLQIKQKYPFVTVAVDANRVEGINRIVKDDPKVQAILLDDAFQHRQVKANLNIVLIDYNRPVYKDHMLPWGRLRDNKAQLRRAEIIIITKCPNTLQPIDLRILSKHTKVRAYQQLYFTSLNYGEKQPIFKDEFNSETFINNDSKEVVVVVGIASPSIFIDYVESKFGKTVKMIYPDHHRFRKKEIQKICTMAQNAQIVLTTEKDSVRLKQWSEFIPKEIRAKMFYIPIEVKFLKDEDKFTNYIFNYVRTNKNDSRLY